MAAVLVPNSTGALARDHAGPHRRLRQALLVVERTVGGRGDPRHDVAADAVLDERGRRVVPEAGHVDAETPAGIHVGPLVAKAEVAVRHMRNAAPPAAHGTEDLPE